LFCIDHKKGNIERKLNELRAPETTSKHILADIFGRRSGSIKENGLIDSECTSEFDKSCRDMKGTWDYLVSGFHSWFIKYEAEFFKKHLIRQVCDRANITGTFSNNRIESVHKVVKDWIGRKEKVSMPACNAEIKSLLRSYSQDFELAVYGQGTYDLSAEFQHLRVERHRWNSMNQVERREAIEKVWKSKLNKSLVHSQACETHIPEVHQPRLHLHAIH